MLLKKKIENGRRAMLDGAVCRICLGEESTDQDPLISICKCAGTMRFIHLECLREWLNQKRSSKEGPYVTTYCWKVVECELCKVRFPSKVYKDGTNADNNDLSKKELKLMGDPIEVLEFTIPDSNFIILESVTL